MKSVRFVLIMMMSMIVCLGGAQQATGQSKTVKNSTPTKRITNAQRRAAAQRLAKQRAAAAARIHATSKTTGSSVVAPSATTGIALPAALAPQPGGVPDYFGSPNWAFSPILKKFIDPLPGFCPQGSSIAKCISVGHPDTITYPGSDYYEIDLRQYSEKMHSDLPPTTMRGYVQVNQGTDASGQNTVSPDPIHYLGPVIIAQKDRPVRIKFTNKLPTGLGGNLFIPTDTSAMGAGMGPDMAMEEPDPQNPMCNANNLTPKNRFCYTENRATLHLHGGHTPWISDGTPHQWITPAGENTPYPKGVSVTNVPDMPDPGPGSQTFYYSNQQSARLLFYHDHSYGITRLNVYAGEAAGYLITDQVEQDLINANLIPAEQIPLVIQDKTFVDATTIQETDPLWNWGTGVVDAAGVRAPNTGDLWMPHVYLPAQNPYDLSGANAYGRWMYGPWFFPPTNDITYPEISNPYYDCGPGQPCLSPWEPPYMPATPNLSMTGETWFDTSLVNGAVYPTLTLEPKAYRFRVLNAANDRFWNLQLYVADPGVTTADGRNNTEVKMIPAAAGMGLPPNWPADGREGGLPDPALAGPAWVQIGTEGGFLPAPVVIPTQPIGWNNNPTTFDFGNVNQHSLLLGPAERADVLVDFSAYAGKTLILYNDAPAAFPAGDTRVDYYTDNPDQTEEGGAPSTQAGFGPNTRTIMQIVVGTAVSTPSSFSLPALQSAWASHTDSTTGQNVPGVFAKGQNPIIVGQSAYNNTYNTTFPTTWPNWGIVRVQDFNLSFKTIDGRTLTLPMERKGLHDEMGAAYDKKYGRMSGYLGLEITQSANTQQFLLYPYAAPPIEIVGDSMTPMSPVLGDGTQIWKISHNGVDTHPIHFHLFDVQLLNRAGWDGAIRLPDANELGWKDTIRVSPLEDTIVALRPSSTTQPFDLPNSVRLIDPTMPPGAVLEGAPLGFTDPTGVGVTVSNHVVNFGWEYVWHCHILSHEEMDMMHVLSMAVAPKAPTNLTITFPNNTSARLRWTDNSLSETAFVVQRATDSAFTVGVREFPLAPNTTTYLDTTIGTATHYYRVAARNVVGDTEVYANSVGFPTKTVESYSNVMLQKPPVPVATITPTSLAFGNQVLNVASAPKLITVTNTGNGTLNITNIALAGTNASQFAMNRSACGTTLASGVSCTISVTFTPTSTGNKTARVAFSSNSSGTPTINIQLTGSGQRFGVTPQALDFGTLAVNTTSANQFVTINNANTTAITGLQFTFTGNTTDFARVTVGVTNSCGTTLAAGANCRVYIAFTPKASGARAATLTIRSSSTLVPTVALTGTGSAPALTVSPGSIPFGNLVVGNTSLTQTVTLSNTGNSPLTVNSIALGGPDAASFVLTNVNCPATSVTPLAVGATCYLTVAFKPAATGAKSANIAITVTGAPNGLVALTGNGVTLGYSVTPMTLAFGSQAINTTGAGQTVTIQNTGGVAITFNGIQLGGVDLSQFTSGTTCGASLAAGASCTASIAFAPTTTGVKAATLNINVAPPATSATVTLGGTGTASAVSLSPTSVIFGNQTINTTSASQTVTVTNTGTAPLTITSIGGMTGPDPTQFGATNVNCPISPTTLAAGASCFVNVAFTPTTAAAMSATLNVSVLAPATSGTATLTGTGTSVAGPTFTVAPATVPFGNQLINTTAVPQTVTITNTGTVDITLNGLTLGGTDLSHFANPTTTCGVTLAIGTSCTASVTFTPTSVGAKSAVLTVNVAAPAVAKSAILTGSGTAPALGLSAALAFGNQTLNVASLPKTVNVSNTGTAPLTINSIGLSGADAALFAATNVNCPTGGATLAPGASCTVNVVFTPVTAAAAVASLDVVVGAPAVSASVGMSGTGVLTIPTFSIAGTVTTPLQGVGTTLTLTQGATTIGTATAAADGTFSFAAVVNGDYTLTATKAGFTFTPASQTVTVVGADITGINIVATGLVADATVFFDRSTLGATLVSPALTTKAGNELLLAFVATDGAAGVAQRVTNVTGGGLTWTLVRRTNTQAGTSEIWRAFAPAVLTNVAVTASLSSSTPGSITVVSFAGVNTTGTNGSGAIGAIGGNNSVSGAPTASIITTAANSWVFGVGNDWDSATARTLGPNQAMVHQYLATAAATFWVQRQNATTQAAGTTVTIDDTAPTADRFNLSVVEIVTP
jgi:FtsP/CotA-like multicopper oxidase with cupredoxin domain